MKLEYWIKGTYDVLVMVLLVLLIGGHITYLQVPTKDIIALVGLSGLHYLFSVGLTVFLTYWEFSREIQRLVKMAASAVLIISSIVFWSTPDYALYQILWLAGLTWLWIRADAFGMDETLYKSTRQYIFWTIMVISVLYYLPWLNGGQRSAQGIVQMYPTMMILGVLYLGYINIYDVFMRAGDNQINWHHNVRRFKKLALVVGILLVIIIQLSIWMIDGTGLLKSLVDLVATGIGYIFYPLIWLMSLLVSWIKANPSVNFGSLEGEAVTMSPLEITQGFDEDLQVNAFPWLPPIIMGLTAIVIMWFVYKSIKSKVNNGGFHSTTGGAEEKAFVWQDVTMPRIRGVFGKERLTDPIRVKYQKWLRVLNKHGYPIGPQETPSQFSRRLSEGDATSKKNKAQFTALTNLYQIIRYGERALTHEEQAAFTTIDDKPQL